MINFSQYLTEARMAPLYHGTYMRAMEDILNTNIMKRGWSGEEHPSKDGKIISLSRDIIFAFNWKSDISGIVIEFDQLKLSQRYKITPFNFFATRPEMFGKPKSRWGKFNSHPTRVLPKTYDNEGPKNWAFENQFEESVHQDIKNVDKYITKIIVKDFEKVESIIPPLVRKSPFLYDYKTKRFVNQ